jgi:NAD(P)-dependent dehydrogenase (short-subunit alcohol dehydrogenase family)
MKNGGFMIENKVVLITGVSSGIGRETAQLLAERGARVFGTVREPRSPGAIPNVELLCLDVTDDLSVTNAVNSVLGRAGRIDMLINNAGYGFNGALEETSVGEARQLFETNFFGVARVTQAVLPAMRRQGYGRIVNVSSVLGFLPAPHRGMYAASKHALEGYTETLDHEVRTFGIRALLVEPALTKTNIGKNTKTARIAVDAYAPQKKRVGQIIQQESYKGDEPRIVAEVVYRALTDAAPRLRYPVGEGVTLSRLRRFVPAGIFDRTFRKRFQLDEPVRNGA